MMLKDLVIVANDFNQEEGDPFPLDLDKFDQIGCKVSSSNLEFGIENELFDPFTSSTYPTHVDFYETKTFGQKDTFLENFARKDNYFHQTQLTSPDKIRGLNLSCPIFINSQENKSTMLEIKHEVSCITTENGYYRDVSMNYKKHNTSPSSSKKTSVNQEKSKISKGKWVPAEDRILIDLVEKFGLRKWSHIAHMLKGRVGKQCRDRWHNHLRPNIKKDAWSEAEDKILIQGHRELGNKWTEIAKRLPWRSENSIKNHWNATRRKQFSRRKCQLRHPRSSPLLFDYIMSLNLTSNASTDYSTNPKHKNIALRTLVQSETMDVLDDNMLVPDYCDFTEAIEFETGVLDEDTIDSLLDKLSDHEEKQFQMGMMTFDNVGSKVVCEEKKELDLVEMISQYHS